jgi:hypothetical protein
VIFFKEKYDLMLPTQKGEHGTLYLFIVKISSLHIFVFQFQTSPGAELPLGQGWAAALT